MTNNKKCRIIFTKKTAESSNVATFLNQKGKESTGLLLAWAEPDPLCVDLSLDTSGRRNGFNPFVCDMTSWPNNIALVEARLFWDKAALHVVAQEDDSCEWVYLEEVEDEKGDMMRSEFPVLTLRDRGRFGLDKGEPIKGLYAIEYRQQGRLVAWRLVMGEKSNAVD